MVKITQTYEFNVYSILSSKQILIGGVLGESQNLGGIRGNMQTEEDRSPKIKLHLVLPLAQAYYVHGLCLHIEEHYKVGQEHKLDTT